ncbi:hypothetical protein, partial [Streptomyces jeddahensis]|uniref:hypothetical protein n=1 Tax=Streptomyces jeddahensis TaxID=1716141 RepID=UPI001E4AAEF2
RPPRCPPPPSPASRHPARHPPRHRISTGAAPDLHRVGTAAARPGVAAATDRQRIRIGRVPTSYR